MKGLMNLKVIPLWKRLLNALTSATASAILPNNLAMGHLCAREILNIRSKVPDNSTPGIVTQ